MNRESISRLVVHVIVVLAACLATSCTQPSAVVGIDAATGKELWRLEDGARALGAAGDVVLISRDDRFAAIDAATGKERWTSDFAPAATQTLRVHGDAVAVVRADGALALVAWKDGAVRWSKPLPRGTLVVAESDDGTLATLDTALDLTVFEARNGDARSKIHLDGLEAGAVARLVAGGEIACFATYAGDLFAVDVGSGHVAAVGDVHPNISPRLDGGRVIAVRKDGTLAAIDAKTGEEAWRVGALPAAATLAVENGIAWVGGQRGAMVGVAVANGEVRFGLPDAGTDACVVRDLAESTSGSRLVVRQGDGLALVESRSGRVAKAIGFTSRIAASARVGEQAFVRGADGRAAGFDLTSGAKLFDVAPGSVASTAVVVVVSGNAIVLP